MTFNNIFQNVITEELTCGVKTFLPEPFTFTKYRIMLPVQNLSSSQLGLKLCRTTSTKRCQISTK